MHGPPRNRSPIRGRFNWFSSENVGTLLISVEDDREAYGELRLQSLGMWRGRVVFLVWTPREDNSAHLISCRYADRQQTEVYFSSL